MDRGTKRASRRVWRLGAVVAGVAAALLSGGVARADLPIPQSISIPIQTPTINSLAVPPTPTSCVTDASFDNTPATPPGTVFRGQSACGSGVYAPQITGQAVLIDIFGNVVATGNAYTQTWGVGTSQGAYLIQGAVPSDLGGLGPVPGLDYTIRYDTSITLTAPQSWGPPAPGCSVGGQTLHCIVTTSYNYIPGTQGGLTPG